MASSPNQLLSPCILASSYKLLPSISILLLFSCQCFPDYYRLALRPKEIAGLCKSSFSKLVSQYKLAYIFITSKHEPPPQRKKRKRERKKRTTKPPHSTAQSTTSSHSESADPPIATPMQPAYGHGRYKRHRAPVAWHGLPWDHRASYSLCFERPGGFHLSGSPGVL